MKKIAIAFAAVLMLAASMASAENLIGMFGDQAATQCSKALPVFVPTDTYIIALLEDIEAVAGAEFKLMNAPLGGANGTLILDWYGALVIGNLYDGISLAYSTPIPGPLAVLGNVRFLMFNPVWVGTNYPMCVGPSNAGNLIVADQNNQEIPVIGWCFVMNCVPGSTIILPWGGEMHTGNCLCEEGIPTEDASWSAIKALY